MNTYEALVILKPIVDVDNSDTVLKTLETAIGNLEGKVLKQDKMGRKRLAYEIKKFKDGFLTNLVVQMKPEAVEPLRRTCSLNEDILRMVITRRDDYDPNAEPVMTRPRHFERGERPERPERGERFNRGGDRPPRGDREPRQF